MTSTELRLARHVAQLKADGLPDDAAVATRRGLFDTVACMLAGLRSAECAALGGLLERRGGIEESTAFGLARKLPASSAAFLNGALAHWCEWDDLLDGGIIHASAAIWPVLLAVAEARGHDGADAFDEIIATAAASYDVAGRISEVLTPISPNGWYSTSVASAAAAAAGGARLAGLDEEGILSAMGLAATASSLLRQPILDRVNGKNALCAQTASVAMDAVDLASIGIRGAPNFLLGDYGLCRMLTGQVPDYTAATADLGTRFSAAEISIKPYPCCRAAHPSIDLAFRLRGQLPASLPERIEIDVCEPMYEVVGRPFEPGGNPRMAALFSIPYTVASALLRGRVDLETFELASIAGDTELRELAGRVAVKPYPIPFGTTMYQVPVTMRCFDDAGQIVAEASTVEVSGSPAKPLTAEEFSRKLAACADGALSKSDVRAFLAMAENGCKGGLAPLLALARGAKFRDAAGGASLEAAQ